MARLRAETRLLHESTETHVAAASPTDVQAYARLLQSLHPLYSSIETQVGSFREWSTLDPPLEQRRRRRAHLLVADLDVLGRELTPSGAREVEGPELAGFEHALGALYVLEGSRLGGAVLARQVSAAVGEASEHALRFLRSDGADVGRLWKEFLTSLIRYVEHSDRRCRDAIILGAVDTFRCFDRHLGRRQEV